MDEIFNADKNVALISQKQGNEINIYELINPCLVAVRKECKERAIPKIEDYIRAQNRGVEVYNATDLGFDKSQVGIIGSPTMVFRAYKPEANKKTVEIENDYLNKITEILLRARL